MLSAQQFMIFISFLHDVTEQRLADYIYPAGDHLNTLDYAQGQTWGQVTVELI
jgi:hypothetical protein